MQKCQHFKATMLENITRLYAVVYTVLVFTGGNAAAASKGKPPEILHFSCEQTLIPSKTSKTEARQNESPPLDQIYVQSLLIPAEKGEILRLRGLLPGGKTVEIRIYGITCPWVFEHFFIHNPLPKGLRHPGEVRDFANKLSSRLPQASKLALKKGLYAKVLSIEEASIISPSTEKQGVENP